MTLMILTRSGGALLLIVAVALYMRFWRVTLSLTWRAFTYFTALIVGTFGASCIVFGDWRVAIVIVGISFPAGLAIPLKLYFAERKLLTRLRMYKASFRQAKEEGKEDEMVKSHALAASCRWHLPRVKEAQEEDLENW